MKKVFSMFLLCAFLISMFSNSFAYSKGDSPFNFRTESDVVKQLVKRCQKLSLKEKEEVIEIIREQGKLKSQMATLRRIEEFKQSDLINLEKKIALLNKKLEEKSVIKLNSDDLLMFKNATISTTSTTPPPPPNDSSDVDWYSYTYTGYYNGQTYECYDMVAQWKTAGKLGKIEPMQEMSSSQPASPSVINKLAVIYSQKIIGQLLLYLQWLPYELLFDIPLNENSPCEVYEIGVTHGATMIYTYVYYNGTWQLGKASNGVDFSESHLVRTMYNQTMTDTYASRWGYDCADYYTDASMAILSVISGAAAYGPYKDKTGDKLYYYNGIHKFTVIPYFYERPGYII